MVNHLLSYLLSVQSSKSYERVVLYISLMKICVVKCGMGCQSKCKGKQQKETERYCSMHMTVKDVKRHIYIYSGMHKVRTQNTYSNHTYMISNKCKPYLFIFSFP